MYVLCLCSFIDFVRTACGPPGGHSWTFSLVCCECLLKMYMMILLTNVVVVVYV